MCFLRSSLRETTSIFRIFVCFTQTIGTIKNYETYELGAQEVGDDLRTPICGWVKARKYREWSHAILSGKTIARDCLSTLHTWMTDKCWLSHAIGSIATCYCPTPLSNQSWHCSGLQDVEWRYVAGDPRWPEESGKIGWAVFQPAWCCLRLHHSEASGFQIPTGILSQVCPASPAEAFKCNLPKRMLYTWNHQESKWVWSVDEGYSHPSPRRIWTSEFLTPVCWSQRPDSRLVPLALDRLMHHRRPCTRYNL